MEGSSSTTVTQNKKPIKAVGVSCSQSPDLNAKRQPGRGSAKWTEIPPETLKPADQQPAEVSPPLLSHVLLRDQILFTQSKVNPLKTFI